MMQWLMAFPSKEQWADNVSNSGIVTVYLLMIVFGMLTLLVLMLTVGQKILGRLTAQMQARRQKKSAANSAEAPSVPVIEGEDDPEVVAAIMAAVAVVMSQERGKKAKFVVRSIKRL